MDQPTEVSCKWVAFPRRRNEHASRSKVATKSISASRDQGLSLALHGASSYALPSGNSSNQASRTQEELWPFEKDVMYLVLRRKDITFHNPECLTSLIDEAMPTAPTKPPAPCDKTLQTGLCNSKASESHYSSKGSGIKLPLPDAHLAKASELMACSTSDKMAVRAINLDSLEAQKTSTQ